MSISVDELCKRYPTLYHMAWSDSWPGIQRHGLLSTDKLVKRFEVKEPLRSQILTQQRRSAVPITHPIHGQAVIRDQKPLSPAKLAACLTDCDTKAWFSILNERVFFWLDFDRLLTLMSAAEYVGKQHTVLHLDSTQLVSAHHKKIELAHMNTGNTRPFAHPRGRSTFRSFEDYSYENRRRLPNYSAVVELTVIGGVPDVTDFVKVVEHASVQDGRYIVSKTLYKSK